MTIETSGLTLFFLFFCLLYNLFLFFYALTKRPSKARYTTKSFESWPFITIMIPALNEARVLKRTVTNLLKQSYARPLEILIINDHSDDNTGLIADELAREHPGVYVLHRGYPHARQGKGAALNHGLYFLFEQFSSRDRRQWLIGVFDGDGRIVEPDFLLAAAAAFSEPEVAAAQCGVRIHNVEKLLPALQDTEFVAFSEIVQLGRDGTSGAVALGGNGQFIRANFLERLQAEGPWDPTALTEDLEMTLRLHLLGGKIRFFERHVIQEGVESWRALYQQRQRWAWGTLQVFLRYVWSGRLLRAELPWPKKLDLCYYLSFWIVPFIVLCSLGLTLACLVLPWQVQGAFHWTLLLANSFSFWPMMAVGLWRARVSVVHIPMLVVVGTLYSYHWIPTLVRAWIKIARRERPRWLKTQRVHT